MSAFAALENNIPEFALEALEESFVEGVASEIKDVIIVGGGIAGLTAAIYAARAGLDTLVIEGDYMSATQMPGGQLMLTPEIENYPGVLSGSGTDLVATVRAQAESFGAHIATEQIVKFDLDPTGVEPHTVFDQSGTAYAGRAVIVATGAVARRLGVPGEDEQFGRGVSVCATCDGSFFQGQPVAVVGGGDSAIEDALYMAGIASHVYVVHRRDTFRTTSPQSRALLAQSNVEVLWETQVDSVVGGNHGLAHVNLVDGNQLDVRALFVAIGHDPETQHLHGTPVQLADSGYISVRNDRTHTNVPGVFAAGDVTDDHYRQAITAAGSGCKAAIDAQHWLATR